MNVRPPLTVERAHVGDARTLPLPLLSAIVVRVSSDGGTATARSGYGPAVTWGPAEPRAAFERRQTATCRLFLCGGCRGRVLFGRRLADPGRLRRLVCVDGPGHGALRVEELRGASAPTPYCRLGDELVAVTHTSGTTGTPKLIAHTGDSLAGQAAIQVLGGRLLLRRHDVIAAGLTTADARTLTGLGAIAAVGAPHLAKVDPDRAAPGVLLTRNRPSLIETFPNVFLRWGNLADHPQAPRANVRILLSTFGADPRTIRRLLAGSERRLPVYAQSEVGAITIGFRSRHAAGPTDDARHVGWPGLALSRARLFDLHSGRPVWRPGRIGRPGGAHGIRVRSPRRSAPIVTLSDTTRRRWLGGSP